MQYSVPPRGHQIKPQFDNNASGSGLNDSMFANMGGGAEQFAGLVGDWGGTGGWGDWSTESMGNLDAWGQGQEGIAKGEGSETAFATANPFAGSRGMYGDKLNALMADPNAITETPGYKFAFDQGMEAINRTSAAKGGRLGGGVLLEAQKFGRGLASQMRQSEIGLLSKLSGADFAPSGLGYAVDAKTAPWEGMNKGLEAIGTAQGAADEQRRDDQAAANQTNADMRMLRETKRANKVTEDANRRRERQAAKDKNTALHDKIRSEAATRRQKHKDWMSNYGKETA